MRTVCTGTAVAEEHVEEWSSSTSLPVETVPSAPFSFPSPSTTMRRGIKRRPAVDGEEDRERRKSQRKEEESVMAKANDRRSSSTLLSEKSEDRSQPAAKTKGDFRNVTSNEADRHLDVDPAKSREGEGSSDRSPTSATKSHKALSHRRDHEGEVAKEGIHDFASGGGGVRECGDHSDSMTTGLPLSQVLSSPAITPEHTSRVSSQHKDESQLEHADALDMKPEFFCESPKKTFSTSSSSESSRSISSALTASPVSERRSLTLHSNTSERAREDLKMKELQKESHSSSTSNNKEETSGGISQTKEGSSQHTEAFITPRASIPSSPCKDEKAQEAVVSHSSTGLSGSRPQSSKGGTGVSKGSWWSSVSTGEHLPQAPGGGMKLRDFRESRWMRTLCEESLKFHLTCGRYRDLLSKHVLEKFRVYVKLRQEAEQAEERKKIQMHRKREEVKPSSSENAIDAQAEASSRPNCENVTSPSSQEGSISTARGDDDKADTKGARGEIFSQLTEDEEMQEKKSHLNYLSSLKESLLYPLPPPTPLSSSSPLIATPYKVPVSLILRGILPHPPTSPSPCFSSCFSSSSSTSSGCSSDLPLVTSSDSPCFPPPPVLPSSPANVSPCDTSSPPGPQASSATSSPSSSSSSFVPIPPSVALQFEENREQDELQQTVFERLYANRDAAWCRRYFLKYQNDFDVSLKTLNRLSVLLPLPILKKLVVFHSRIKKVWPLPILAWMSSSSRTLAMRTWGTELDALERRGGVPPDSPGPSQGVLRRTGGGRFAGGIGSSQQRRKVLGCMQSEGNHTPSPAACSATNSSASSYGGGGVGDGVHTAVGSTSGCRGGKTKSGERKKRKSQKKKWFSLGQQRKSQNSTKGGITMMSLRSSQVEEGGGGDGDEGHDEVAEEGVLDRGGAEDRGDDDKAVDPGENETHCPDVSGEKEVKRELKGPPEETAQREGEQEEGERTGEGRKEERGEPEDTEKVKATGLQLESQQNRPKKNDEELVESSVERSFDQSPTSGESKEAEERRSATDRREEAKSVGETKSEEIMMVSQGEDKRKDDSESSPLKAGGTSNSEKGMSAWVGEGNLDKGVVVKMETDQGEEAEEEEKKKNKGEDDEAEDGDDQSGDEREASRDTDDEKWQRQGFAGKREAEIVRDLAEHLWAFLEERYFPGSHASSSSSRKRATSSEPGGCSEEGLPGVRASKLGEETGGGGPCVERPGDDSDSSVSTSHVTVPSRSHRLKRKKSSGAGGTYQSRHTGVSKGDEEGNVSSSTTASSTAAGLGIHPPCTRRKAACREEKKDSTTAASVSTLSGTFSPSRLRRTRQRVEREAVRLDEAFHSSRNSPGSSGGSGVCGKGDPPSQSSSPPSSCPSSSSSSPSVSSSSSSSSSSASHLLSSPSPSSSGRVPPPSFDQNSQRFSPPRYHTRDYSPSSPSSILLPVPSSSTLIGESSGGGDLARNHIGVPPVLPFPSPSLPLQENASDRPFSTDSLSPRNHHLQSHIHDISTSSSFSCSSSSPSAVFPSAKLLGSPPSPALEKRDGGGVPPQQSLSDQQRLLLVKLLEQLGIAKLHSPANRSEGEGETQEPYVSNRSMVCNQDFQSSSNRDDSNTSPFIGNQQEQQRHSFLREDSTSNRISSQSLLLSLQQKQEQQQQEGIGTTGFQQDHLSRRLLPSLPSVGRELLKLLQATRDQRQRRRVVKGDDEERFESVNSHQEANSNNRSQDERYSPYPHGIVDEGDSSSLPAPNSSLVGPPSSFSTEGDRRDLFLERNHQSVPSFDLSQLQRIMQQARTTNKREGREGEGGMIPASTGVARYLMGDANNPHSRTLEREGREDQKLSMSLNGKGKGDEIIREEGEEVSRPIGLSSLLQFVRHHASSSSGSS